MSVDPASLMAMAQIARIVAGAIVEHHKGTLTKEGLEAAWTAIHIEAADARAKWEQSKLSPAARAAHAEAKN